MPRTISITAILSSLLMLSAVASCRWTEDPKSSPSTAKPGGERGKTGGSDTSDGGVATNPNGGSSAGDSKAVTAWTMVTEADLKSITGADYSRLESQGDYSYMKHCSYQDSAGGNVSVTAVLVNAQQRYDAFLLYPNRDVVDGIGAQASWCPDLDTLCVLTSNAAVEVQFRQQGTDVAERLKTAKLIASLVLDRL